MANEVEIKGICIDDIVYIDTILGDFFGINADDFKDISVDSLMFSVRAKNVLNKKLIRGITELLQYSPIQMFKWENIGAKTVKEIIQKLYEYVNDDNRNVIYIAGSKEGRKFSKNVYKAISALAIGENYSQNLSEEEKIEFSKACEIIEQYGWDTFNAISENLEYFTKVQEFILDEFGDTWFNEEKKKSALQQLPKICERFGELRALPFINAYYLRNNDCNEQFWKGIDKNTRIKEMGALVNNAQNEINIASFNAFCSWLNDVDIDKLIAEKFTKKIYCGKNKIPDEMITRYQYMIEERLCGRTLESVGKELGVTRERVRQQEEKVKKQFVAIYESGAYDLLHLIYAIHFNDKECVNKLDVSKVLGQYQCALLWDTVATKNKNDGYLCLERVDMLWFTPEIEKSKQRLREALISMPKQIDEKEKEELIQQISVEYGVPADILEIFVHSSYKKYGTIYSSETLYLSNRYEIIMNKHFPEGMLVYDEKELVIFRNHYKEMFGDDIDDSTNHAISTRIGDITILCDRGKYKIMSEPYISQELLSDICKYIDEDDNEVFLTNTIYHVFEERLRQEGINNKYHMQGILHKLLADKYFFRRDYVSKSKEAQSIYPLIISFIEEQNAPVTKEDIKQEFPGISDVVIAIALQNQKIIVGFGVYIAKNLVDKQTENLDKLQSALDQIVSDGEIHHINDIMSVFKIVYPDVLEQLFIDSASTMYSIAISMFADQYSFKRPYVAKLGIAIANQEERKREFFENKNEFAVQDFVDFSHENDLPIYSILLQMNAFNDEFVFKDKENLIRTELLSINKYVIEDVEDFLIESIKEDGFVVGTKLSHLYLLPKIGLPWNSWLIYSIINKWSNKITTFVTDPQFRYAEPVFVLKNTGIESKEMLIEKIKKTHDFDEGQLQVFLKTKGLL